MRIKAELDRLQQRVEEMAGKMPFGIIGGMTGSYSLSRDNDGVSYEFTLTIEPFSEFHEVESHTFSFRRDESGFSGIRYQEHGVVECLPDLPGTDAGLARLAALMNAWLERICPHPPGSPAVGEPTE